MKYTCISNIERNTSENVWLDQPGTPASLISCSATELSRTICIHGPSGANYHIPPLTKVLPFNKLTSNKCLPCQDLLIDACIVTVPY